MPAADPPAAPRSRRGGLELHDLSMAFGTNAVLRGVSMPIAPRTVTALIGANGAGKSTLIKILSGVHRATAGEVHVDGEPREISSTAAARELGIETVHQRVDEGIVPGLSVAENLLFDRIISGAVPAVASLRRLIPRAREVAATLQLDWSTSFLRTDVFEIGIADQQLLLLARALSRCPRLLVLDEPTSALSAGEVERLFAVVRQLRDAGVAVLYVSHHLGEIDSLADRLFVLRDGEIRADLEPPFDWHSAVRSMLGEQVAYDVERVDERRSTETALALDDVRLFANSSPFSIELRSGEVTGVFGLLGAGKTELATGIVGASPFRSGTMRLRSKRFAPRHPADAVGRSVYLVPEDRASQAMLPGWSITRTSTLPFLPRFASLGVLRQRREARHAAALVTDLGVVAQSAGQPVDALSGGNQQKVVVGRWMRGLPTVLVLDEPFRGVDLGARRELSVRLRQLAGRGAAVAVLASDVDEILEVADRVVVLAEGELRSDRYVSTTDRDQLLADVSPGPARPQATPPDAASEVPRR